MFSAIRDSDILRNLRYKGVCDEAVLCDINRLKSVLEGVCDPRYVCACFKLSRETGLIHVKNTALKLTGTHISRFLEHTSQCYLVAATLGIGVDRAISKIGLESPADALISDAIANCVIELYMDKIQYMLFKGEGKRFSCGYGDLPISVQPEFLAVLNAQKAIGLYCNEQNLMIPQKSVTAIIAEGRNAPFTPVCEDCEIQCVKREAGDLCGY